jgi:hypothetical protein
MFNRLFAATFRRGIENRHVARTTATQPKQVQTEWMASEDARQVLALV